MDEHPQSNLANPTYEYGDVAARVDSVYEEASATQTRTYDALKGVDLQPAKPAHSVEAAVDDPGYHMPVQQTEAVYNIATAEDDDMDI